MAEPKRKRPERERDLVLISDLFVRGHTQQEIADRLAEERDYRVTRQTISRDVKTVEERWRERSKEALDMLKARELAKLDAVEAEAWSEYLKSKEPSEATTTEQSQDTGRPGRQAKARRTNRVGAAQFLNVIQGCVSRRASLLGLNAPTRVSGPDGEALPPPVFVFPVGSVGQGEGDGETGSLDGEDAGDGAGG